MQHLNSTESTFLNMIKAPCIEQGKKEGILPSVMAAIAISISKWGTTPNFYTTRNVYMLPVLDDWYDKCYSVFTGKMYDSPKDVDKYDSNLYRVYSDHQKSVKDFIAFMASAKRSKDGPLRYGSVIGCTDYKETVNRLIRAGFMQHYMNRYDDILFIDDLIAKIEAYHLYEWDEELKEGK